VIRWEEPPAKNHMPGGAAQTPWRLIAEQLRSRPGEWAVAREGVVGAGDSYVVSRIKTGDIAAFRPAGTFDATQRTCGGQVSIYVRYVGEPS
jgi:hypothetical protein